MKGGWGGGRGLAALSPSPIAPLWAPPPPGDPSRRATARDGIDLPDTPWYSRAHTGSVPMLVTPAPGTGPTTWTTVRHTPAPASATARAAAWRESRARYAHVGPEPETIAASAPCSMPAASVRRSS